MRRAIIIAACLAAGAAGAFDASPLLQFVTAQSFTPLTLGPVAWYKFDGDANDSSGNGRNGTPTNLTYTTGMNGQAGNFAGVGYVTCPSALVAAGDFAISLWAQTPTNIQHNMVGQFGAGQTGRFLFRFVPVTTTARLGVQLSASAISDDEITLNSWQHCVISRTGTTVKLIINNGTPKEATLADSVYQDVATEIGRGNADGKVFQGLIDDVLFFNRALTQSEITQIYNWRQ